MHAAVHCVSLNNNIRQQTNVTVMAKYTECPNCGNSEEGYTIQQCKHCGGMWCLTVHKLLGGDGCSAGATTCMHCGEDLGFMGGNIRTAGYIAAEESDEDEEEDDD